MGCHLRRKEQGVTWTGVIESTRGAASLRSLLAGRYADPTLTELEHEALRWLDGFYQLEHLLAARAWVKRLLPEASEALRFAALVHDAERFFPGGPDSRPKDGFDNPDYLFAHSLRSADIVGAWLDGRVPPAFARRVRSLILRHEIGGDVEEDVLQASDSLAWLSAFDWLAIDWVRAGHYTIEGAREKLDWMMARMRPPHAIRLGLPMYADTIRALYAAHETTSDIPLRRKLAGDRALLLGETA